MIKPTIIVRQDENIFWAVNELAHKFALLLNAGGYHREGNFTVAHINMLPDLGYDVEIQA